MTGDGTRVKSVRILVTGGEGKLATALRALDHSIDAPSHAQMDVSSWESIQNYCRGRSFNILLHAAAVTNKFNENADERYIRSNIIGTANIVLWCMQNGVRLVYISSDYVYPAERGDYTENSPLLPANRYAKSKLGGEMAAQLYHDSLIIRTSFYAKQDFAEACTDQFTSRMPLQEAAKAIYDLALRQDVRGVINVGFAQKRSVYDIVRKEFRPDVRPCRIKDLRISYRVPSDSSMDISRYARVSRDVDLSSDFSPDRKTCRVCGSKGMKPYLDLGTVPLANAYLKKEELDRPEFTESLVLQLCRRCGLTQLTKVVPPERMFRRYLYKSSTPETFRAHCRLLAQDAMRRVGGKAGDLALDIASNDGCLLSKFQDEGMRVVGVDPAENLATEADKGGIPTVCTYWSLAVAKDIVSRFGSPKIVTSQNVLGHTDDVHAFAQAVEACLAPKGLWIIEVPYVLDFVQHNEFDTAYHEHLSYFSVHPLRLLLRAHAMDIMDVAYFPKIHGGTIRLFACRRGDYRVSRRVETFLKKEGAFGLRRLQPYRAFAQRVRKNKEDLLGVLSGLRKERKTIWAYGAGAKGNILMNYCGIRQDTVPVVVDDNAEKWGYYAPGSQMRITKTADLKGARVDYLLLLAWNFKDEIIRRCKAAGFYGGYVIPNPTVQLVKNGVANERKKVLR